MNYRSTNTDMMVERSLQKKLHVGSPNVPNRQAFLSRVEDILDRNWLTNNGPVAAEFASAIQSVTEAKHVIPVANATLGLLLALRSLDLRGEVILPSFTFIATAHIVEWQGLKPIFCDVDPNTHNLDPTCAEQLISKDTAAIVPVHLWGRPCETAAISALAKKHNLRVVYDAAHAFGASLDTTPVGSFGDAEVFSFHATKAFNALEGGAVTTNCDDIAAKVRSTINFGFTDYDQVSSLGLNAKLNEVSAAMGVTSIEAYDEIVQHNKTIYDLYSALLGDVPGMEIIDYSEENRPNYHYIVVSVDEQKCGISRDRLVDHLHNQNIVARRYFYPGCHKLKPYIDRYPNADEQLPVTNELASKVMCLPNGLNVNDFDVHRVVSEITRAIDQNCRDRS